MQSLVALGEKDCPQKLTGLEGDLETGWEFVFGQSSLYAADLRDLRSLSHQM